jgi:hypothetical protein
VFLVFTLTGCSNLLSASDSQADLKQQNEITAFQSAAQNQGKDYSVEVSSYDIDPNIITPVGSIVSESSYPYPCQTVSELESGAPIIVVGTILNREFFAFEGIAHTKLDLVVNVSIKGEFEAGDIVTIVQSGGYVSIADIVAAQDNGLRFADVPEEQWASTYFVEFLAGQEFPTVGEEFAYFLKSGSLISGSYWPVNDYEGSFKLDANGQYYTRYNPVEGYVGSDNYASETDNGNTHSSNVINSFTLDDLLNYFS